MPTDKSGPSSPLESTNIDQPEVIDLYQEVIRRAHEANEQRKREQQARAERYGKRYDLPKMTEAAWKREFCQISLTNIIWSLLPQLSKREFAIVLYLATHPDQISSQAGIVRATKLEKANVAKTIQALVSANFVIKVENFLTIQPHTGLWDLQRLKAERPKRNRA